MIVRSLMTLILAALLLNLHSCQKTQPGHNPDLMYFILIDRFADGDSSNNSGTAPESYLPYDGSNPAALGHYQGGDLQGITQNLKNLKELGMTMVWISPFLDNSNTDYVGWWPYHGYHPIDFYAVDEHFGTLADLKQLVESAHALGLKIIFDMPFNQTAQDHPWLSDSSRQTWFHQDAQGQALAISDWFDQEQIEVGELHGLPDLAQENPKVRDYLIDVSKYWIKETGCDGFRLDAVKHIPQEFWQDYNREIKAFAGPEFLLMGEVFWGEPERIVPYKNLGFDCLFDIPGYYAIRNTFSKGSSMKDFSSFFWNTEALLSPLPLATLIDNHDVARFNVGLGADAWPKQLLALGWLISRPGLPVIYYGTELGMPGYPVISSKGEPQDYLNRLPYPDTLSPEDKTRIQQFRSLMQLRHDHPALSQGSFVEIYKDWSIYAFLRLLPEEVLLVVINNAGSEEFVELPVPPGSSPGTIRSIYGPGVLREEGAGWRVRLPGNSFSLWSVKGITTSELDPQAKFTDHLSKDYQEIAFYVLDPQKRLQELQVAGDFNNWKISARENFRRGDSLFVTLPLKPGEYQYKLVLDGSGWESDPRAAAFVTDPYGGRNSVISVLKGTQ